MNDKKRVEMIKSFSKTEYHVYEYNYETGSKNLWTSFDSYELAEKEQVKRTNTMKGWIRTERYVAIIVKSEVSVVAF